MKIAFPTSVDQGLESPVFGHFGSAPYFILADSTGRDFETVENPEQHHDHGRCQPTAALGRNIVDAVVVGGIGGGALHKLLAAGITVFRAVEGTINENLELINAGRLPEYTMDMTCSGHSAGGGCAH